MASISSLGIGSGILTSDLVDQLINAEREPIELRLDRKQEEVEAELSAIGQIKSALTDLRLPARVISNGEALQSLSASSSSTALSVTAGSTASTGQYSVEVVDLAQAHSIRTGTFSDKDTTTLGTGTLTFTINGQSTNITIDGTNNTLDGIANAINAEDDLGVNADVIYTGTAYVLAFTSQNTGAANEISITVDDDDGTDTDGNNLSRLAFNATQENLTESVLAQDANITVNGITNITRSSNTFSDVVEGLTFNLSEKTTGPATINVTRDTDTIVSRVTDFIDSFNTLKELLNELTEFDPNNTANNGIFVGDSTVRSVNNQLRSVLFQAVPGLASSNVRSLADVGISSDPETGLLSIDESVFTTQLNENPDDIVALFAEQGRTSDAQVSFLTSSDVTVPGTYAINVTTAATRATFTGSAALGASTVIDSNNDTFALSVDGTTSGTITLTAGTYTQTELLAEIQTQLDADTALSTAGVSATVSLDGSSQLVFQSDSYGSSSSIEITAIDTVNSTTILGLSLATGTAGVDVAGTIDGVAATGSGQTLRAATGGNSEGISVLVQGTTTGSRGTVTYIEGIAEQLVDKLTSFIEFEGIVDVKESGLSADLTEIDADRAALEERLERQRQRLVLQFTSADILVGQLQSTQDFLETQFKAISATTNSD